MLAASSRAWHWMAEPAIRILKNEPTDENTPRKVGRLHWRAVTLQVWNYFATNTQVSGLGKLKPMTELA
jgi:hypothetical protein